MKDKALQISLAKDYSSTLFELLLLADPSKQNIEQYLYSGQCFIANLDAKIVGAVVLKEITSDTIEVKNIAIHPTSQGKGFGKQLLQFAEVYALNSGYHTLIIGTGNSSINQLALYQKVGYEMVSIKKDFFVHHYDQPIFENGIQCKHMIVLEKQLLQ